jgi:cyanosortase A-associated protein
MNSWKTVRTWLLATIFVAVLLVFFKTLIFPREAQLGVAPFVFPATVPLSGWQLVESKPFKITDDPNFGSSQQYRYQQHRLILNIDSHYIIRTSADVKDSLNKHLFKEKNSASLLIRKNPNIGFHLLFNYQNQAYLSSCINPRGGSTVTFDQFRQNRNTYDLQPKRLALWIIGLEELRDWRCLWNVMSVPLETLKPEEAYAILESAWYSWYSWWEPRFPKT